MCTGARYVSAALRPMPLTSAWIVAAVTRYPTRRDTGRAMSQENVEVVLWAIVAFNRRDMRGLAEFSHEDLEFVSVLPEDARGATYRGSEAWTRYFAAMDETWEEWQAEDFRLFDGGEDRVAGLFRLVGTARPGTPPPLNRSVPSSTLAIELPCGTSGVAQAMAPTLLWS